MFCSANIVKASQPVCLLHQKDTIHLYLLPQRVRQQPCHHTRSSQARAPSHPSLSMTHCWLRAGLPGDTGCHNTCASQFPILLSSHRSSDPKATTTEASLLQQEWRLQEGARSGPSGESHLQKEVASPALNPLPHIMVLLTGHPLVTQRTLGDQLSKQQRYFIHLTDTIKQNGGEWKASASCTLTPVNKVQGMIRDHPLIRDGTQGQARLAKPGNQGSTGQHLTPLTYFYRLQKQWLSGLTNVSNKNSFSKFTLLWSKELWGFLASQIPKYKSRSHMFLHISKLQVYKASSRFFLTPLKFQTSVTVTRHSFHFSEHTIPGMSKKSFTPAA